MKLLWWLALCLVLSWDTASAQTLDRAWAAAMKGDRSQAVAIAQSVVRREPANADARLLLGSLLVEQGQREEAIHQLTEAVHLRPKSAEAWNALGEASTAFADSVGARNSFEQAVRLDPHSGIAQANLGAALLQSAEPEKATGHLDRAIQLLGNSADAADPEYLRAKIYSTSGQTAEAARHLERAVKLRPDFAQAWSDLGEVRRVELDTAGALAAFQRAVQLNARDAVAQYRLGEAYLNADQTDPALEHLEAAYELTPSDQSTLNALQTALRRAGRIAEAERIKQQLAAVLRERDEKSRAGLEALKINNEGAALERSGNVAAALDKYRQALSLAPEHNGIRVNYATALLRLGHWTEGLTALRQAAEREPGNDKIRAALKDALAQAPPDLLPEWAKTQRTP